MNKHELIAAQDRHSPEFTPENQQFFKACAEGKLCFEKCTECGHTQHYPRNICVNCGGEVILKEASGLGTVYTYSIVRFTQEMPFKKMTPYAVAIIELEEGVRMLSNVVDCDPGTIKIGMPVRVVFSRTDENSDIYLPFWKPL